MLLLIASEVKLFNIDRAKIPIFFTKIYSYRYDNFFDHPIAGARFTPR